MLNRIHVALAAALFASAAGATPDALLKPGTSINGKTPEQLSVEWWQWAAATEGEKSPVRDTTGAHCAVGQSGRMWFLAGGFGISKTKRMCTVPEGVTLFFPVVNLNRGPTPEHPSVTCADVKEAVSLSDGEHEIDLHLEIDGIQVPKVSRYRVATEKCFDLLAKVPKNESRQPGFPTASDGYWVSLRPLTKGRHTLKFGAKLNRNSEAPGQVLQDVVYELQVGSAASPATKEAEREQPRKAVAKKPPAEKVEAAKAAAEPAAEEKAANASTPVQEQKQGDASEIAADVDRIVQRAMADFPVLKTPQGEPVLESIWARQKEIIAKEQLYPSIAMVEAVADHRDLLRRLQATTAPAGSRP